MNPESTKRVPSAGIVIRGRGFGTLTGENPKLRVIKHVTDRRAVDEGDTLANRADRTVGFIAVDHVGSEYRFNFSLSSACWVAMVGISGGIRWA